MICQTGTMCTCGWMVSISGCGWKRRRNAFWWWSGRRRKARRNWVALSDGYQESEDSWRELLLGLRSGLKIEPHLAIGDGALGFWKALPQVFGTTRRQRCWVHKTANILNKLPKRQRQGESRIT
ncbi:transposase (plasmid) [Candidatus Methylocalor cossyra]|uniref:Mutator family transposase n=1 Tax=Candidatus Methylocalor cossyra TaxID=3108543 RepID=A0ABM9NN39_9GAMM